MTELYTIPEIETNQLDFIPLSICENIAGNYDNYLRTTISHILKIKKFEKKNSDKDYFFPNQFEKYFKSNKKILLLDLDETLIHADFFEEFPEKSENKYDKIISFYTEEPTNFIQENTDNNTTDDESKDDSGEKVLNKVGIFLRPKVQEFLKEISNYFEIGIFTASIPEYADAVINYLDPDEKLIKFRLYRNDCVNLENVIKIKDLRIFGENNLNRIVLLDNNIYSFSAQLSNGILINSFFCDKNDDELANVRKYLIDYIYPSDDVRKINEQFFGFETLFNEFSKLHF